MGIPQKQYIPEHNEGDAKLASGVASKPVKVKQQEVESVKDLALSTSVDPKRTLEDLDQVEPQKPLTEDEVEEIQATMRAMVTRVQNLREKTQRIQSQVDDSVNGMDSSKTAFIYNLNRRPRLKRAVRAVFGQIKPVITYSDYLKALEIKRKMEEEEAVAVFEKEDFGG